MMPRECGEGQCRSIAFPVAPDRGGWQTETSPICVSERVLSAGVLQVNPNFTSIFDLSPSEKLQLVEDLWDDLASTPEAIPVHEWQKEELDRRKANLLSNPASGLSWEEVQRRVRSRHGRWMPSADALSRLAMLARTYRCDDRSRRREYRDSAGSIFRFDG